MQCIIQARMSSSRLPGKSLIPINGITLLERVFARLEQSKALNKIIVATSDHQSDDPIEEFCESKKFAYHRSSLNNVYKRFIDTLETFPAKSFVRTCADSPLLDAKLIDLAVCKFHEGDYDLVTNTFPRTYPKGQSVEVIDTSVFYNTFKRITLPEHREHITKFFYDNHKEFNIHNLVNKKDYSDFNHCVDTADDLIRIEKLLKETRREQNWTDFLT